MVPARRAARSLALAAVVLLALLQLCAAATAGAGAGSGAADAEREAAGSPGIRKAQGAGSGAADALAGAARLGEALRLRQSSVHAARAALLRIGNDELLPPPIRGAALTELALAHENLLPSFVTRRASGLSSGSGGWADGAAFALTTETNPLLNRTRAVELYRQAALFGNATAQFRLGTLQASGALGVERDPVQAVLNYYFAALNGSVEAAMALGFRHSFGLGVPKDCQAAVIYYELAANQAVDEIEADGVAPLVEREWLSLDRKTRGYAGRSSRGEDEEVVDYYKHAAEKGDVSAIVALGQIYFYGARGVERDHARAADFFRAAAAQGDPMAQANLGHLLVKGMGVEQDIPGALANFTAAAEAGSPNGINGLGYMHLYGLGVARDADQARKYFSEAAEANNAEALYNLGALYVSGVGVKRRNYPTALNYFSMAAQKGHTLAMHKLAQMNLHGVGVLKNCDQALNMFKAVAERGRTVRLLSRGFSFWNNEDDPDSALQVYLVAAELGFEVAQANAGWLLDDGADLRGGVPTSAAARAALEGGATEAEDGVQEAAGGDDPLMAVLLALQDLTSLKIPAVAGSLDSLRLYQLAAEQGNVEARLKIGDFFYYGLGGDGPNYELAAHHYKQGSDLKSAQAMFNLGYMHQYGIGLPRDLHLAKRFYDTAESTHADAKVPVSLALTGLYAHRMLRAVWFGESSADLPPVVAWLANWVQYLAPAAPSAGGMSQPSGGGGGRGSASAQDRHAAGGISSSGGGSGGGSSSSSSSSSSSGGGEADDQSPEDILQAILDTVDELEDDTVVALCLSVLLCFVLYLRAREQRGVQAPHEHAD